MTDRELMQQALSVLCNNVQPRDGIRDNRHLTPKSHAEIYQQTIDTLRDRLVQTEPGPVAHTLNCVCGAVWDVRSYGVEEMVHTPDTPQPQRKPLTHPQIHEFDWPDGVSFDDILSFVRVIEEAHGIKE